MVRTALTPWNYYARNDFNVTYDHSNETYIRLLSMMLPFKSFDLYSIPLYLMQSAMSSRKAQAKRNKFEGGTIYPFAQKRLPIGIVGNDIRNRIELMMR